MFIFELEDLEDITDTIVFEDEPSIFTEEYILETIETVYHLLEELMNDNPTLITEPDFYDILLEEIQDIFYIQLEDQILTSDFIEDDMNEILEYALQTFIISFDCERSSDKFTTQLNELNELNNLSNFNLKNEIISTKIEALRNIPQPTQRTPEWYQFRHNLITASNAYKAFESQPTINQLIYEKCQPLITTVDINDTNYVESEVKMVNVNTSLHWGQKYEPLSVMIYEEKYNTKVEDFGCIRHPQYHFIGASPDGINVDTKSALYGRMLEIKNVVSREINSIPKKEYWIQMQLQMEVCDLDECDFLETKFTEYSDYVSYKNDETSTKGIIIYFHTKEGKPFYVYKPLDLINNEETEKWEENTISLYSEEPYNYTYIKFIYWKLDKLSCVLVLRNREWFKNNITQLEKVWNIIEEERVKGYQHRAPVKKPKKTVTNNISNNTNTIMNAFATGCFVKVNKLNGLTPNLP